MGQMVRSVVWMLLFFASSIQAAPTFQAAGTAVTATGSVSPAWPTHAVDDIALLFIESTGGQPATLSTPAGFAAVTNSPQATGTTTSGTRITVFWARATSTSMATPTVADPGDHVYARIITYRGVINTGNPWDVTGGGVKATSNSAVSLTSVTTTVLNTLIVQVVARNNDRADAEFSGQSNGSLTGISERADGGTTSSNGGGFAVWDGAKATAGATGSTTASIARSTINAFLTIALKPSISLHHIRIEHDGIASNCAPESVTLKACINAACTAPLYSATDVTGINLSPTSAGNTWSPSSTAVITAASGGISSGNITLARATNGTTTLAITGTASPVPSNTYECYNTATGTSGDCSLVYSGSFSFNVLDHTSATRQVVALTSCTATFAGTTRSVKLWSTYANPASGTLTGKVVAGSGNVDCATGYSALGTSQAGATTLSLAFGSGISPQATFSLCYPDTGQVRVDARYDGSPATADNGVVILGNDSFIAKPDRLTVSNIKRTSDNFSNPGATNASGTAFVRAGDSTTAAARFTATVTAKNALNVTTPNFGIESSPEGITMAAVLVAPVGGDAGLLTCKNSVINCVVPGGSANFSGGATTVTDLAWDDVGIIQLLPDLGDGNYLGTGALPTFTASANIGRFYADHLAVVAGSASLQARAEIASPITCVASGQSDVGDIATGTNLLSISDVTPFSVGDGVVMVGAGASGADLFTTVTAIDSVNDTLTLASNASTTVTNATVFQRAPFSYMGEPMLLSFQLQALNAANSVTKNYDSSSGFAKLTAADVTGYGTNDSWGLSGAVNQLYGVNGCRALFGSTAPFSTVYSPTTCATQPAGGYAASAARISATGTPAVTWTLGAGALGAQVVINRANTSDGPFNWLGLGVLPQDSDGALTTLMDFDTDSIAGVDRVRVGVADIRLGRLKISNLYGSNLLPLPVPVTAQYWTGVGFATNTLDSCTSLASSNFTLTPGTGGTINTTIQSGTMTSGTGTITLTKPTGFTTTGSVIVNPGLSISSFLPLAPASGLETFGIYKSGDGVIYMREMY
ncbi:MAG: DUF6701 domain-containing protein [Pseudomonadota bacterium]